MKNILTEPYQKPPARKNAQGMVEFALVLPVLLLMIIGVIEFSRLMFAWVIIENSTRFGIRYAVTGNFEPKYCTDYNQNCASDPSPNNLSPTQIGVYVDEARIPSIEDETKRIIIGFIYNELLTTNDPNYLRITVCSNRKDAAGVERVFTPPLMGRPEASAFASCSPSEDAADSGQRVWVAADYNFTFIVLPLFGIKPNMIHLASYREGQVEQFRGSKSINTPLPPAVFTNTPTPSNTPSNTPTNTNTPTPTKTNTPTNTPTATRTPTPTRTPTARSHQLPRQCQIALIL